jgi:hypothetical protein
MPFQSESCNILVSSIDSANNTQLPYRMSESRLDRRQPSTRRLRLTCAGLAHGDGRTAVGRLDSVAVVLRAVPDTIVREIVPAAPARSGWQSTFAAPVDGGLVVAGAIDTIADDTWALVFVDVPAAAALAIQVLQEVNVTPRAFTHKFGFPVIEPAGTPLIVPGSVPLGLDAIDMECAWTLADRKSNPLHWIEAPSNRIMFTWWDEVAGLNFAYPVVITDGTPGPIEQELARRHNLAFHHFTT